MAVAKEERSMAGTAADEQAAGGRYVYDAGVQYGPAIMEEIIRWMDRGLVGRDALIWNPRVHRWEKLAPASVAAEDTGARASDAASAAALPAEVVREEAAREETEPAAEPGRPSDRAPVANRRRHARLPLSVPVDLCVMAQHPRPSVSLPETIRTENISSGGLSFRIFNSRFESGSRLLMKIHLDDMNSVDALGKVVRIDNRTMIGVEFKEIRGRDRLLRFLAERRLSSPSSAAA